MAPKPAPVRERLERHSIPEPNSGCTLWTGTLRGHGYGTLMMPGGVGQTPAHRLAWELENGPIPKGAVILHKCDNRACINPAHLECGTQGDNMRDMVAKGRNRPPRGEKQGASKLKTADVIAIKESAGTNREVAALYGINPSQVSRIRNGLRWAHIQ